MIFFRRPPDRDSFYGVKDLPDLAVRNGRWKLLCEYDGSSPLLYDLLTDREETKNLAKEMKVSPMALAKKIETMKEVNPMLGHRGCRLGITFPDIYRMQVRAIVEAACRQVKKGIKVFPEIT